jgi:multidrug efflux pump subunit AcrA (membrane-fusion protein)
MIVVPRTPQWRVQIQWLIEDGSRVRAGDRVVDFDNSSFVASLEEDQLAAIRALRALEQARAETEAANAAAEAEVERRRIAMEKARLDASIPSHLMSAREAQDRELALQRAVSEHDKAVEDLAVKRRAGADEIRVKEVELTRARRAVEKAERAIEELSVVAPQDGIVLISTHRWEGRKFQEGDAVWVGLRVAEIPDLTRLRVRARLWDVDDGLISEGLPVLCSVDAYPEISLSGTIGEVSPVAVEIGGDSLRRSFDVVVELDSIESERLQPGMSVKVDVALEHLEDVLVAPRTALDLAADPPRVRLSNGRWREVDLGACSPSECVVEAGLEEGVLLGSVWGPDE